jgi:hypothetical protein
MSLSSSMSRMQGFMAVGFSDAGPGRRQLRDCEAQDWEPFSLAFALHASPAPDIAVTARTFLELSAAAISGSRSEKASRGKA